jgi:hypothetical protein
MPSLGKSMVPCERDVINIGIAQCSLAELMADPLIGLVMKSDGVERRDLELLSAGAGRAGAGGSYRATSGSRPRGPSDC